MVKDKERCTKILKNGKRCIKKREPNPDGLRRTRCKKHRQKTSELKPQTYDSPYTEDRGCEHKTYRTGFIR